MPLNGKKLSIHSVGTMTAFNGFHPAVYDPEDNQRWYWPNITFESAEQATEWAQHALTRAKDEPDTQDTFARWNIYLG